MTTIKSYTDISQSKKLAEILPLESADMYHFIDEIDKVNKVGFGYRKITADFYSKTKLEYIPCWSLAALLSIFEDKGFYYKLYFDGVFNVLEVTNIDNPNIHEMNYNDYSIDVCVAMIEKLHKLNLL